MKRFLEILTGILIGALVGILYRDALAPYLPLLVILAIVLFIRHVEVK